MEKPSSSRANWAARAHEPVSATLLLGGGGGASAGSVTEVLAVPALGVGELVTVLQFVTLFLAKATADGLTGLREVLDGASAIRHDGVLGVFYV